MQTILCLVPILFVLLLAIEQRIVAGKVIYGRIRVPLQINLFGVLQQVHAGLEMRILGPALFAVDEAPIVVGVLFVVIVELFPGPRAEPDLPTKVPIRPFFVVQQRDAIKLTALAFLDRRHVLRAHGHADIAVPAEPGHLDHLRPVPEVLLVLHVV